MHKKDVLAGGTPVGQANKAVILLHGRGSTAENILSLADHLKVEDTAFFAPQATNQSWYPYSFMVPEAENQPALDSALEVIGDLVHDILEAGIPLNQLYFLGFSQGACLSLEYTTRNAKRYGGIIAFTGGLIGATLNLDRYVADFGQTPVLITTGDPDPHVPLSRVNETVEVLKDRHAEVDLRVYKGRMHTIQMEEITLAAKLIINGNLSNGSI